MPFRTIGQLVGAIDSEVAGYVANSGSDTASALNTAMGAAIAAQAVVQPAANPNLVPEAPTKVTAIAGATAAQVTWSQSQVGYPFTQFTVTASPGGANATVTSGRSATVTGLTNGTSYTFTVTARNVHGISGASAASNTVTPNAGPGALGIQGLVAWWDASQLAGLSDGAAVTSWPDVSGNGFTATQATTAAQPVYKATAGTNGIPSVYFTGQQMLTTNLTQTAIGSAMTIFVVANLQASTSGGYLDQRLFSSEAYFGDSNGVWMDTLATSGNGWRLFASSWFANFYPTASTTIGTADINSITVPGAMWTNGAADTGVNGSPIVGTTPFNISGTPSALGSTTIIRGFQGYISEFIVYRGTLSTANRHSIEGYLATKYGKTVTQS